MQQGNYLIILSASIAFFLAIFTTWIDLLFSSFKLRTLWLGKAWTMTYFLVTGAIAVGVFLGLFYLKILNFHPIIKAVVAGVALQPLLKSKIFMLKIGDGNDRFNPAATYERITEVFKRQISQAGLVNNLEFIQQLQNLPIDKLKNQAQLIILAHEMWDSNEKQKILDEIEDKLKSFKEDEGAQENYLISFILRQGQGSYLVNYLIEHRKIPSRLELAKLSIEDLENRVKELKPKLTNEKTKAFVEEVLEDPDHTKDSLISIIEKYS